MSSVHSPLHPRPQRARAAWVDLSGTWGFAYDDADRGLDDRWQERAGVFDRQIEVPFPPESPASGIGDTSYHPIVWYRRTIDRPLLRPGQRALLHCSAVDYRAQVWVNGTVRDAERLFDKYRELVTAILASPTVAGFCYTQLTDVLQETNGLLTAGREPKVDPDRIQEVTAGYTAAVPSDSTERMRAATRHIEALPATTSATR